MRKVQLLTAVLLLSAGVYAQNIKGIVNDGQGKPMNGSTVSLLLARDSSVLKLAATKEDGRFQFENIKDGHYLVRVTNVGQSNYTSAPFDVASSDVTLPAI